MPQRHPKPSDELMLQLTRPIQAVVDELERLRTSRAELRQNNAALTARVEQLTQGPAAAPAPESEALWEAYSAGVQNGYDHKTEGVQPNWFAVREDFDAWQEQTKP